MKHVLAAPTSLPSAKSLPRRLESGQRAVLPNGLIAVAMLPALDRPPAQYAVAVFAALERSEQDVADRRWMMRGSCVRCVRLAVAVEQPVRRGLGLTSSDSGLVAVRVGAKQFDQFMGFVAGGRG